MANIVALKTLLKKCIELKLPEAYIDDFSEHDFNYLMADDAPESFLWVVRECGTFLYNFNKEHWNWIDAVVHTYGAYEKCRWFLFKDGNLTEFKNSDEWRNYYLKNIQYVTDNVA